MVDKQEDSAVDLVFNRKKENPTPLPDDYERFINFNDDDEKLIRKIQDRTSKLEDDDANPEYIMATVVPSIAEITKLIKTDTSDPHIEEHGYIDYYADILHKGAKKFDIETASDEDIIDAVMGRFGEDVQMMIHVAKLKMVIIDEVEKQYAINTGYWKSDDEVQAD